MRSVTREAKDFVVSRIVEEAQREGRPLSESERRMLYVSATEMSQAEEELCADFDRESDQDCFERKIASLIKKADKRYHAQDALEYGRWRSAIRLVVQDDHYIGVMIARANLRPPWDFLKLVATAVLVVCVVLGAMMGAIILMDRQGIDTPSKEVAGFWTWVTLSTIAVVYCLVRLVVGKERFDAALDSLLSKARRIAS